jgi:hypothetical protein
MRTYKVLIAPSGGDSTVPRQIDVEAEYFQIDQGGVLVFYRLDAGTDRAFRAVARGKWLTVEEAA